VVKGNNLEEGEVFIVSTVGVIIYLHLVIFHLLLSALFGRLEQAYWFL